MATLREKLEAYIDTINEASTAPDADKSQASNQYEQAAADLDDAWQKVLDQAEDTEASPQADQGAVKDGRAGLTEALNALKAATSDIEQLLFGDK